MIMTLTKSNMLFRAFAQASRLRILNLLLEGELCVCDLCDALKVLQPRISRHLAYLKKAGLVKVRREGKWKYYSLADRADGLQATLLHCVQSCLRETDILQKDLRRLHSLREKGCCPSREPCIQC